MLRILMASGTVVRPGLGISAVSVTPQVAFANDLGVERYVLLVDVEPDGPAEQAGLRKGDVIIAVGGQRVRDLHDFHAAIWRRKPGDAVEVSVRREAETLGVRVVLRADPSPPRPPR